MKTLRAKIALLLVISIVSVVALISLAVVYIFTTPKADEVAMLARQFITMEALAKQGVEAGVLSRHPDTGSFDRGQTQLLRAGTARLGTPLDVMVTYKTGDFRFRTASVPVGPDRWILVDFDPSPAPELWAWFVFITVGVGSISVFLANRMSKPLALLERAVESVGKDTILPLLPVQGPTEVRATAMALNTLSERLQRAVESRMRLVAAAGHDLRTPLTRMRLRTEFVCDDEERALWKKDIDELERIAESAIQLVHDEVTKQSHETVRLDQFVGSIVGELRELDYAIALAEAIPVLVKANPIALSRALRNLLINAATHGMGGKVSVLGGALARIVIEDEGPGIAPELFDQVFEPFFRADRARGQEIPGVGLGLTIAREIVRKAGGEIEISNRPDGGLLLTVQLPAVLEVRADEEVL